MGIWNTIKVHKYWLILSFSQDVLLVPKRGVPGSFQALSPVSQGPPALPAHYGIQGLGVGSHFAAPDLGCLLDAPSSWAIGQMDSFDSAPFQKGKMCRNLVPRHCWEPWLRLGVKPPCATLKPLTHFHLCRSERGKPHISTWNRGKKQTPIPDTKPHKSFMQSFSLCICSLVSQPECLINRFLFCPPRSSEKHWRVGSALAHPGCWKGSSPGMSAPNLLHFYCPNRCPAHRAVGLKIFKN